MRAQDRNAIRQIMAAREAPPSEFSSISRSMPTANADVPCRSEGTLPMQPFRFDRASRRSPSACPQTLLKISPHCGWLRAKRLKQQRHCQLQQRHAPELTARAPRLRSTRTRTSSQGIRTGSSCGAGRRSYRKDCDRAGGACSSSSADTGPRCASARACIGVHTRSRARMRQTHARTHACTYAIKRTRALSPCTHRQQRMAQMARVPEVVWRLMTTLRRRQTQPNRPKTRRCRYISFPMALLALCRHCCQRVVCPGATRACSPLESILPSSHGPGGLHLRSRSISHGLGGLRLLLP